MLDTIRPDPNAGKSLMQLKAEAAEEAKGKRKAEEALNGKGKRAATESEVESGGKVTLDRGVTEAEMEQYRRERRDLDFDDPLAKMGKEELLPM